MVGIKVLHDSAKRNDAEPHILAWRSHNQGLSRLLSTTELTQLTNTVCQLAPDEDIFVQIICRPASGVRYVRFVLNVVFNGCMEIG